MIASVLALPASLILQGFQGSVLQMIAASGPVAKTVLLVLLAFSFLSWAVMIERYRVYRKALLLSGEFLEALQKSRNLADIRDRCERFAGSPLVSLFKAGFQEMTSPALFPEERRFPAPQAEPHAPAGPRLERIQRVLDRAAIAENDRLEAFLGVLATTGSVTPFVGLFGTVWGIMNAFQKIGIQGSASLGAVAPGISEALVTTAAGLAAAIPAVIGYNYFLGRLRRINSAMDDFGMRFTAIAERHLEGAVAPGALKTGETGESGKMRI